MRPGRRSLASPPYVRRVPRGRAGRVPGAGGSVAWRALLRHRQADGASHLGLALDLPRAVGLPACGAVGLVGLAADLDRLLVTPAVLAVGELVGLCGRNRARVPTVGIVPDRRLPRPVVLERLRRGLRRHALVAGVEPVPDIAAEKTAEEGSADDPARTSARSRGDQSAGRRAPDAAEDRLRIVLDRLPELCTACKDKDKQHERCKFSQGHDSHDTPSRSRGLERVQGSAVDRRAYTPRLFTLRQGGKRRRKPARRKGPPALVRPPRRSLSWGRASGRPPCGPGESGGGPASKSRQPRNTQMATRSTATVRKSSPPKRMKSSMAASQASQASRRPRGRHGRSTPYHAARECLTPDADPRRL